MNNRITQAIFHITYNCQHHCPMCYANAGDKNDFPTLSSLEKIIDQLVLEGICDITLVGGDPVLFPNILELCKYIKTKNAKLTILSNTLGFGPFIDEITKYVDVFEGTIHHSSAKTHDEFCGCQGAYDLLSKNLRYFSSTGRKVGIAINLIPFNYNFVYEMIENLIDKNVIIDHVVFQRIIQFGRAKNSTKYELTHNMIKKIMPQIEKAERDFNVQIIFEDPLPICALESKYAKYIRPCEWGHTKVSIDYKGNISRCGADVFHSLGNIFDNGLYEIWENNTILDSFRTKKYLPQKCLSCNHLCQCGGGCPISRNPENGFSVDYLSI